MKMFYGLFYRIKLFYANFESKIWKFNRAELRAVDLTAYIYKK